MALPQDQTKAVAIRRLAVMLCLITVLVVGATIASLLTGRWGWAAANGLWRYPEHSGLVG